VVDAALYESAFSFMEPWIPAYDKTGFVANRCGSRLPESTPNNLYPTGDGQFIHVTAMGDAVFRRLAEAMGQPALAHDARFATATARSTHVDEIDDLIAQWTNARPLAELEQVLEQAAVPAMRIFTIADIFADPHYRARGAIVRAPDPELGTVAMAQAVPRLSQTPGAVRHAGHRLGEDSRTVLRDWLGLDSAALDTLQASRVILDSSTPPDMPQAAGPSR
jgi:crotonobetainyl-CoA:carnitine CoA-transferase CaiB-like acyl-CoA transferase